MKKIFSILLILAMLFSTVGVTVASGYCKMMKAKVENTCCKNKCKPDCCNKNVKVFKLDYDTLVSHSSKIIKQFAPDFISSFIKINFSFEQKNLLLSFSDYSPPPLLFNHSLSKLNVFLI